MEMFVTDDFFDDVSPVAPGIPAVDLSAPIDFVASPFVVLRDQREKAPWGFHGIHGKGREKNKLVLVRTEYAHLPTGDYTIDVARDRIAIERKSLEDLYSTIGQHRERFERELVRLNALESASVIVEANLDDIILRPPSHSRLNPQSVYQSVIAWGSRYRNVHWCLCGNRRLAEVTCWHVLNRFYKDHILQGEPKP